MTLMPVTALVPSAAAPVRRRVALRRVVVLLVAALVLPVAVEALQVVFGCNLHTVVEGRVYRCAQPSADTLDQLIVKYQIRTVINLRGTCELVPWYLDECRATHKYNVAQEDINFSAGRFPSVTELRRLLEVLDNTEYPILLHCRRGADRTGMAAMMVLLLKNDGTLAEARRQLGWRYGHVAVGRTAALNQFADFYVDWLQKTGKQHCPGIFRDWALHHYCPGGCWSVLSWAEPPPDQVTCGKAIVLRVRVRNASMEAWHMSPLLAAGVHLGCHVFDETGREVDVVKTGLRDGEVLVGQTVDFTLVLPPFSKPGRYVLQLDMVEEQLCWFYQTGSQPLEQELIVCE
jgi:hypothetical protein